MSASANIKVARPYAKAVFQHAKDTNLQDQWSAILAVLAHISADEQVQKLLAEPLVTSEQKAEFFINILTKQLNSISQEAKNFVCLLAENKRLQALPEISFIFEALRAEQDKIKKIVVTSAIPLEAANKETLTTALKKKFNSHVEATWQVDTSVLGGIIIRADDFVIDGSIKGQLSKLTKEMTT